MYDYSDQINSFHGDKVVLSKKLSGNLTSHRTANENRLIKRLPELKNGVKVSRSSFKSQGSFAMRTIIQTKFSDEEYDIDDGLVLWRSDIEDEDGNDMTSSDAKELIREALKDSRFKQQPKTKTNCVRVFYADEDEEKHHVDFPVYRKWETAVSDDVTTHRELAGGDGWVESDPTRVNSWFENEISSRNSAAAESGTQMRQCLRLLKRFCRSRSYWDMPNGMKLTMLTVECFESGERIDSVFRDLLDSLHSRLLDNLEVENLADEDFPRQKLTRTSSDENMIELRDRLEEALGKLEVLDDDDCTKKKARQAWDWVFKSDGYFDDYDGDDDDDDGSGESSGTKKGIATSTPNKAVDPKGGGRFG
ncbi:cyclic GMP-AMP synthase DncV-like nucleotidyltransferase [Desulfotignum balticum]|uniref:cyclic GMP-AMP synthase DncV-like nucleotidyltransferase n=1 Tax=Desulfotignum balticum TaxID=115781 RepID=UPI00041BB7CC|nr:hypothetical protein [Desulfotignum balticum]